MNPAAYARLRALADRPSEAWALEIGPTGLSRLPSPPGRHAALTYRIVRQLEEQIPRTHPGTDLIAQSGAEIEDPSIGRMRRPDAVVVPFHVLNDSEGTVDAAALLAVVEVVSKNNPDNDYVDKVADYPAMGIPLYLLVDPRKGVIFTYQDILPGANGPRYGLVREYAFGDTVPLGPWHIASSDFQTYAG